MYDPSTHDRKNSLSVLYVLSNGISCSPTLDLKKSSVFSNAMHWTVHLLMNKEVSALQPQHEQHPQWPQGHWSAQNHNTVIQVMKWRTKQHMKNQDSITRSWWYCMFCHQMVKSDRCSEATEAMDISLITFILTLQIKEKRHIENQKLWNLQPEVTAGVKQLVQNLTLSEWMKIQEYNFCKIPDKDLFDYIFMTEL